MNILDTIFTFYDKAISSLSPTQQAIISLALLIFLLWQIYHIIRRGHWLFIALLLFFLPSTWPAARFCGHLILTVMKLLLLRIQSVF
jgi:hypothetical protein